MINFNSGDAMPCKSLKERQRTHFLPLSSFLPPPIPAFSLFPPALPAQMLIKCQMSRVGHDLATEQAGTIGQALGPGCLLIPNSPFRALQTLGSHWKSQPAQPGGWGEPYPWAGQGGASGRINAKVKGLRWVGSIGVTGVKGSLMG